MVHQIHCAMVCVCFGSLTKKGATCQALLSNNQPPQKGWGATPNKNPATALVRAGDFPRKLFRMKNDSDSGLRDGFGLCVTQNVGKNNGKWCNTFTTPLPPLMES